MKYNDLMKHPCVAVSVVYVLTALIWHLPLAYRKHGMRIGAIASLAFFLGILLASTAAEDGKLLNFAVSVSSVSAITHHAILQWY